MNAFPIRRAAAVASCMLIMGQSPHCAQQVYVNYHFDLAGCPDDAFQMPDSVARGEYELYSSRRKPDPPCPGFQLYDFIEEKKGLANPDLITLTSTCD